MSKYKRVITYDLNYANNDDYEKLYELLDEYKAEKLTESTYLIITTEDWKTFYKKFFYSTQTGDIVKAIVRTDRLEVRTIRD